MMSSTVFRRRRDAEQPSGRAASNEIVASRGRLIRRRRTRDGPGEPRPESAHAETLGGRRADDSRSALELRRKSIKPDDPKHGRSRPPPACSAKPCWVGLCRVIRRAICGERTADVNAAEALPADTRVPKPAPGMPDRKREALNRSSSALWRMAQG